jgi:hypothetical protein
MFHVIAATSLPAAAPLAWRTVGDHVALIATADDTVVWQFNHPAPPGKPHFHPVALPGGPPLTWHAPPDHPWHLGLWFSWKFINGRNYWETDRETGRSEGLTRVDGFRPTLRDDFSARLEIEVAYVRDDDSTPVLRELRVVEISAPASDGSYHFDWTMTFSAQDERVVFDRTPLPHEPAGRPWGGYAGLIWRFSGDLRDWQVVNSDGSRDLACHGAVAVACDFSGTLHGGEVGVAMIDDPRNPRAPTPWYVALEHDTPFAAVMPAPLFRESLTLPARESMTLRYRVAVHPGRWKPFDLRVAATAFTASP